MVLSGEIKEQTFQAGEADPCSRRTCANSTGSARRRSL